MNSQALREQFLKLFDRTSTLEEKADKMMSLVKDHVDYLEMWKPLFGFPEYQASTLGRIKHNGKILNGEVTRIGYRRVTLPVLGGNKKYLVHRLVAESFIPNYSQKPCVNHIDNDKLNNRVDNLEWCSHKENSEHLVKEGRHNNGRKRLLTFNGKTQSAKDWAEQSDIAYPTFHARIQRGWSMEKALQRNRRGPY